MKISRLFEIVFLLMNQNHITADQLAERFEVSTRTIYRDLDALSAAGIPIYGLRGKGGGIALHQQDLLDRMLLSPEEKKDLVSALQGFSAVTPTATRTSLEKVTALFQSTEVDWIDIDFSGWETLDKQQFQRIREAILGEKALVFSYINAQGTMSRRETIPLKLHFKHRFWYLFAFCLEKKSYRLFKLTRMHDVTFSSSAKPVLPPYTPALDHTYHVEKVAIELTAVPTSAVRLYDDFPHADIERHADGSFTVRTEVYYDDYILNRLIAYGAEIRILEPQWLKAAVIEVHERALALYHND